MTKIKVGIIGLGIGEQHLLVYDQHPECEVFCVCDFSKDKRAEIRKKYPHISIIENADELLENEQIQIVSIASNDNFHYGQIIKAIHNGKHVFVEKPLCLFEDEARKIKKALCAHPEISMSCNFVLRTSPRFQELKQNIDNGKMGDLFSIEADYNYGRIHKIIDGWRGNIPFYSVVCGGAVHMIDLILWMTGKNVVEVLGYGNNIATKNTKFKYNDFVSALLMFEDGMIARISSNFACMFPHFHCVALYGTEATFINDLPDARLYTSRDPSIEYQKIKTPYKGINQGKILSDFIDYIIGVRKQNVSSEEVFRVMSICFAIEKAVEIGQAVIVDYI